MKILKFAVVCFLMGCATVPPPVKKIKNIGWFGEKLPPGLKRRLKALPGEPALRKIDGTTAVNPQEAKEYIRPRDRAVMVYLPGGKFLLGCHNWDKLAQKWEKPRLKIQLKSYYMDKYEVSQGQFQRFVGATGYQTVAEKNGFSYNWNGKEWAKIKGLSWKKPWSDNLDLPQLQKGYPVAHLAYSDCVAYAKWAGGALPTEAQWEKSARGTDGRPFPWGPKLFSRGKRYVANYTPGKSWEFLNLDGYKYTAPVDSFPEGVSPYGCFNMAGNVWEWCRDYWETYFYRNLQKKSKTNPQALVDPISTRPSKHRVIRGGGWTYTKRDHRTTSRGQSKPGYTSGDLGFRCMMTGVK